MVIPFSQDIDILVTPDGSEQFDPEDIKKSIVDADSRYYLQPSEKPGANYKVLFCRLPGFKRERRRVKVDILIPLTPRLWIPKVLSEDIWLIKNIPVMPLFDLLVMKMQGWRDHRASRRSDFRAKVEADVTDIRALLARARWQKISYRNEYRHHTRGFMGRARRLALGFVEACGGQTKFEELDFPM